MTVCRSPGSVIIRSRKITCYFFSRLAADALAADLSSFAWFSPLLRLTAFFADVLFFAGFTFRDLADFFTIVARN